MAHLGGSLSAEVQRINSLASQPLPAPRRPALHPATSATIEVEGKRFDVAFSLAREQRDLIEPIALELRRQRHSVFFYAWPEHEAELAKPNLDNHLRRIYGDDARLLVPVLSADYERKPWTGVVELTVIRELIVDRRDDEIMALRTDNATVTGFSKLHGYVDVRGRSAVEIANLIGSRLGQVKLERQRVGAEQARLEEERKQDAATSAVSGQELVTFSGAPHRPPQPQITRMQDGVVHFALTKEGQFVGGTEALRRVSADVLQGDWNGDLEIHHAFLDGVQQDIRDLLAHGGLSADQGKKLERLRTQASSITSGVETVCLAVKLAFVSAEGRERTWGVPMQTEETLGFLAGLFVEARLAAPSAICDVPCQLYVPRRVSDPVCIDLRLSESETKDMRELWEQELMTFPDTTWRLWDWPNLVPIWHLRDQLIAARLLPAIAISVAGRVRRSPPQTTMAGAWEDLRQVYFPTERDPLVPYHWCLALQSERSPKDLARLTSPPHERAELHTVLGFRR